MCFLEALEECCQKNQIFLPLIKIAQNHPLGFLSLLNTNYNMKNLSAKLYIARSGQWNQPFFSRTIWTTGDKLLRLTSFEVPSSSNRFFRLLSFEWIDHNCFDFLYHGSQLPKIKTKDFLNPHPKQFFVKIINMGTKTNRLSKLNTFFFKH